MLKILLLALALIGNAFAPGTAEPQIILIKDLNANAKPFQYFSLVKGKEVSADSAKTAGWDLAFSKTTILVNGGSSGPGNGGAQMSEKRFDTITEAPQQGYKTDNENGNAIAGGSGNSWYTYDMGIHAIVPIPGRTILVKTASGQFAKMEIINYYKGAPENVPTEESSYFTFRYVLADDNGKF
ncbi:hypothetical protein FEM33_23235 [Dyadobacter flavalbus]|uniref:HmuY protein n=1 Tax=Dyadobacter flavalbus TaxID=2579942 RepID=A0A5M8QCL5_9BACT|nr:HmuY family protein [Dyadobacter flavalbus]KAA6432640.1 hypothetical protein FEM33_23235 [Dyadobacter flavalbus]